MQIWSVNDFLQVKMRNYIHKFMHAHKGRFKTEGQEEQNLPPFAPAQARSQDFAQRWSCDKELKRLLKWETNNSTK